jgi:hypothetical protein
VQLHPECAPMVSPSTFPPTGMPPSPHGARTGPARVPHRSRTGPHRWRTGGAHGCRTGRAGEPAQALRRACAAPSHASPTRVNQPCRAPRRSPSQRGKGEGGPGSHLCARTPPPFRARVGPEELQAGQQVGVREGGHVGDGGPLQQARRQPLLARGRGTPKREPPRRQQLPGADPDDQAVGRGERLGAKPGLRS